MDYNEMPNEIYIQLGENRIGTEICLRRWQETPFEGGIKYTRAQPKYKRVDLDAMKGSHSGYGSECTSYNRAIDDIKSKYGDLWVVIEK